MATMVRQKPGDPRYAHKTLQSRMTEDLKVEFGRRLQAHLIRKGWNQSDLARFASAKVPGKGKEKRTIGRDLIGLYIRAAAFPNPIYLQAIADALGVPTDQLVPAQNVLPARDDELTPFSFRQLDAERMHIRLNRTVSTKTANAIFDLLRAEDTNSET